MTQLPVHSSSVIACFTSMSVSVGAGKKLNVMCRCCALDDPCTQVGDKVGVKRTSEGNLHFYINGVDQGVAAHNVPARVYGVIDLYGQAAQASVVDHSGKPAHCIPLLNRCTLGACHRSGLLSLVHLYNSALLVTHHSTLPSPNHNSHKRKKLEDNSTSG